MEVILHKSVKHSFKKLPRKICDKFYDRVELFKVDKFNPVLNNHSVDGAYVNSRSINITGDYRLVFREEGDVAIFIDIGTHSELYG